MSEVSVSEGGAGRHVQAIVTKNPQTIAMRAKLVYTLSFLSGFSVTASRAAFITLYLRIFVHRWVRVGSWVVLCFLIGLLTGQTFLSAIECRPLTALRYPSRPGKCVNELLYFQTTAILNMVADIAILILPVHTVWNLHASTARKASTALVFA